MRSTIVSIPGGERYALHIDEIVAGLVITEKYIYLCTDGLLEDRGSMRASTSRFPCMWMAWEPSTTPPSAGKGCTTFASAPSRKAIRQGSA
ncbi:MAG: hypothetical protein R3C12_12625 [Planctomycetaceae bacterium]